MPLFGRKKKEESQKQSEHSAQLPTFSEDLFPNLQEQHSQAVVTPRSSELPSPHPMNQKSSETSYERPLLLPIPVQQQFHPSQQYQVVEKPSIPVFVKLDRYNQILQSVGELKRSLEVIKETFDVVNEMEKIKTDTLKMLYSSIDRVDKKIQSLDSEFTKPAGFVEETREKGYGNKDLEDELGTLRNQINSLRSELEHLA